MALPSTSTPAPIRIEYPPNAFKRDEPTGGGSQPQGLTDQVQQLLASCINGTQAPYPDIPPVAFRNDASDCYRNVTLLMLLYVRPFLNLVHTTTATSQMPRNSVSRFQSIADIFWDSGRISRQRVQDVTPVIDSWFQHLMDDPATNGLSNWRTKRTTNEEGDAVEFLSHVLDWASQVDLPYTARHTLDLLCRNQLITRRAYHCSCHMKVRQPFSGNDLDTWVISVNADAQRTPLATLLANQMYDQVGRDGQCPSCNANVKFEEYRKFKHLPEIFFIGITHIIQTTDKNGDPYLRMDNNADLDLPEQIDLSQLQDHHPSEDDQEGPAHYQLTAVIAYGGTGRAGHYYIHVRRHDGTWVRVNDAGRLRIHYDGAQPKFIANCRPRLVAYVRVRQNSYVPQQPDTTTMLVPGQNASPTAANTSRLLTPPRDLPSTDGWNDQRFKAELQRRGISRRPIDMRGRTARQRWEEYHAASDDERLDFLTKAALVAIAVQANLDVSDKDTVDHIRRAIRDDLRQRTVNVPPNTLTAGAQSAASSSPKQPSSLKPKENLSPARYPSVLPSIEQDLSKPDIQNQSHKPNLADSPKSDTAILPEQKPSPGPVAERPNSAQAPAADPNAQAETTKLQRQVAVLQLAALRDSQQIALLQAQLASSQDHVRRLESQIAVLRSQTGVLASANADTSAVQEASSMPTNQPQQGSQQPPQFSVQVVSTSSIAPLSPVQPPSQPGYSLPSQVNQTHSGQERRVLKVTTIGVVEDDDFSGNIQYHDHIQYVSVPNYNPSRWLMTNQWTELVRYMPENGSASPDRQVRFDVYLSVLGQDTLQAAICRWSIELGVIAPAEQHPAMTVELLSKEAGDRLGDLVNKGMVAACAPAVGNPVRSPVPSDSVAPVTDTANLPQVDGSHDVRLTDAQPMGLMNVQAGVSTNAQNMASSTDAAGQTNAPRMITTSTVPPANGQYLALAVQMRSEGNIIGMPNPVSYLPITGYNGTSDIVANVHLQLFAGNQNILSIRNWGSNVFPQPRFMEHLTTFMVNRDQGTDSSASSSSSSSKRSSTDSEYFIGGSSSSGGDGVGRPTKRPRLDALSPDFDEMKNHEGLIPNHDNKDGNRWLRDSSVPTFSFDDDRSPRAKRQMIPLPASAPYGPIGTIPSSKPTNADVLPVQQPAVIPSASNKFPDYAMIDTPYLFKAPDQSGLLNLDDFIIPIEDRYRTARTAEGKSEQLAPQKYRPIAFPTTFKEATTVVDNPFAVSPPRSDSGNSDLDRLLRRTAAEARLRAQCHQASQETGSLSEAPVSRSDSSVAVAGSISEETAVQAATGDGQIADALMTSGDDLFSDDVEMSTGDDRTISAPLDTTPEEDAENYTSAKAEANATHAVSDDNDNDATVVPTWTCQLLSSDDSSNDNTDTEDDATNQSLFMRVPANYDDECLHRNDDDGDDDNEDEDGEDMAIDVDDDDRVENVRGEIW